MMFIITYVSSANALITADVLNQLLAESRVNNLKSGITGLLLYKEGNFMQTLEGTSRAVNELYRKIKSDSRHSGVITLLDEEVSERSFSTWAMAFQNLDTVSSKGVPGYSEFLDKPLTSDIFQDHPTVAQRLLMTFRKTCGND